MNDYINNRKIQKWILAGSTFVVIIGLYYILTGDMKSFLKDSYVPDGIPRRGRMPFNIFFCFALVMAFFSAKNLIKKKTLSEISIPACSGLRS
jgi:hypothetical protein